MPTSEQLEGLYRICYYLTYRALQPIHLICIDERTGNLFILAGDDVNHLKNKRRLIKGKMWQKLYELGK